VEKTGLKLLRSNREYKTINATERTTGSRLVIENFDVSSLVNKPSACHVCVINNVINNLWTHTHTHARFSTQLAQCFDWMTESLCTSI